MTPEKTPICEPIPECLDADLHLHTQAGNVTTEQRIPFVIDDERKANWLVTKIIQAREYSHRVKRWAEQEIRRSEREESRLLYLFGRQLEVWATAEIAKFNGRRKRICLPGGQIGFRRRPMKLVVVDEDVVMAWARENCPQVIKTVERLMKKPLNEHFVATGEVPDLGIRVEAERESFYVK